MDPLVNADPKDTEPEPTIPQAVLRRLMGLFTPAQLSMFVTHAEEARCNGYGQAFVEWRAGKIDIIGHQASDKA